jgi:hypothetical protein
MTRLKAGKKGRRHRKKGGLPEYYYENREYYYENREYRELKKKLKELISFIESYEKLKSKKAHNLDSMRRVCRSIMNQLKIMENK